MATKPYRQNLSGAQGTTLTGAHGGTQQLGEAAQRRLQGNPSGPGAQPTGPAPGARTPPPFDPATLKPGAGNPNADGNMVDYTRGGATAQQLLSGQPGPNSWGSRNPNTGGVLSFPGAPGEISFPGTPGAFPGGAPGIASMDGTQGGVSGPPGWFGRTGQQLGVQAPGSDAGNIDNAISSLRQQLGMSQQQPGGPSGAGSGVPNLGPVTNYGPTNVDGGANGMPNFANLRTPTGTTAASMEPWGGGRGFSFGASPGTAPVPMPGGKPLPNNGAAGIAAQAQQRPNPYAGLLRQRLASFGGGGGVNGNSNLGPRPVGSGAMGGLRGY